MASAFGEPVRAGGLMNNSMFMPWAKAGKGQLSVSQQGTGKPWLTVQSVAAVVLKAPFASGYSVKKTITPVEQADKGFLGGGQYTRGDVLRVTLEVQAKTDMTWVAISDPIPRAPPFWAAVWVAIRKLPPRVKSRKARAGSLMRSAASRPTVLTISTCPQVPARSSTPCA